MPTQQDIERVQDSLRPIRNFIAVLSGAAAEQSTSGQDCYVINPPGQFSVQGPNGVSQEGRPVLTVNTTPSGNVGIKADPWLLGGLAVAAYLLMFHK
jgi:hypothetical protein